MQKPVDRTAATLCLAAMLLIPAAYLNLKLFDDASSPLSENAFLIRKVHAPAEYDMVLGGNSRMMQGISPAVMREVLPELRILNLGLRGASLTPRMCGTIEAKLDPHSPAPMVLLGIEPGTLQESNDGSLVVELNRSAEKRFLAQHRITEKIARMFSSIRPFKVVNMVSLWRYGPTAEQPVYYREYHPDGWSATYWEPEDLDRDLKPYRDDAMVLQDDLERTVLPFKESLFEQVRQWSAKGIVVFGVRIPTSPEVRQHEDRRFDFDEKDIIREFETSGGIWITVNPENYHCYDGGHLHKNSAIEFSRYMADAIKAELAKREIQ